MRRAYARCCYDGLREKCIQLYSLIKAGCPPETDEWDPLTEGYAGFYRYNISTLLLEIATRSRVLDDVMRGEEADCVLGKHQFEEAPGTFETGGQGDLSLREIANKVLHASTVELVCSGIQDEWEEDEALCRAHTGAVRLHGKLGDKNWAVILRPIHYCREILGWLDDVEDNGRLHKIWQ